MAVNRQYAQLNHVDALPDELLADIFSATLNSINRYNNNQVKALNGILAVCSRWRRVALNYANLWSSVTSDCWAQRDDHFAREVERIKTCMARSRQASLDVAIRFSRFIQRSLIDRDTPWQRSQEADRNAIELIPIIKAEQHRIKSLSFDFRYREIFDRVIPLTECFKKLQHLHIDLRELVYSEIPRSLMDKGCAPSLRVLKVEGVEDLILADVSGANLELISLVGESTSDSPTDQWNGILRFIARCPQARELCLLFTSLEGTVSKNRTPSIILPRLTKLSIYDELPITFHRQITSPNLEHLCVNLDHNDGPWGSNEGLPKVPIWPKLKTLHIHNSTYLEEPLLPLLTKNPSISLLSIYSSSEKGWLLEALVQTELSDGAAPEFLPNLAELWLMRDYQTYETAVDSALASRLLRVMQQRQHLQVFIISPKVPLIQLEAGSLDMLSYFNEVAERFEIKDFWDCYVCNDVFSYDFA